MINKEGWEIKKLGEICEILNGGTPVTSVKEFWGGNNLWVTPKDLGKLKSEYIIDTERKITESGIKNSSAQILPANSIVLSSRAPIGYVAINTKPICTNQGCKGLIPKSVLVPKYLYFFLKKSNQLLKDLGTGATFKELSGSKLASVKIPFPSNTIQQQIVTELDTLSEIIAKKKRQLAELDNLAQATFYDMFGDPVRNEKGWDKDSIVNVAPVKSFKGNVESYEGKYWLLNLDMIESNTGNIISVNLVEEKEIGNSTVVFSEENVLYSKLRPYLNKVIIPFSSGYATSELLPLLPKKNVLDKTFLAQLLRSNFFVGYIQEKVAGAKMPRVSMDIFRAFQIILPPLTLQTQFAEKINAIEKQKELIKKSIDDTQMLFDYTMDKYFN